MRFIPPVKTQSYVVALDFNFKNEGLWNFEDFGLGNGLLPDRQQAIAVTDVD